jgi:nitroreductase/molybdopterin/thiamine biosynthesis adenylyltransferase
MTLVEKMGALAKRDRARPQNAGPILFSLRSEPDRARLEELLASGDSIFVHDTLEMQLAELIETRTPDRKLTPEEIHERALAHAGGNLETYGIWVYYPWSRRLVRVLPEREYEELRTSRNRNKITRKEQDALGKLRIGIAGLSVGQSTAVTLALEGVGGIFRLADFDALSLSNMNRLRAGAHEIGVDKTAIVAREIYELNPYAKIEIFDRGITDDSLPAFFGEGQAALDLLFEECDDLKMKVRLRHEARKRRIPVLMETSDRGLFDVERFDKEPTRPPFHGLVGELDPEKLGGMTTYEKVPIVLAIIGAKTMSKRMAASLIDIDATLKTWPQLASAVALGSAINTDAARRIALGKFSSSGRYFVDVESIINDRGGEDLRPPALETPPAPHADDARPAPIAAMTSASMERKVIERLVHLAALAPSGGNCQPWRFRLKNDVLQCFHEVERSRTLLDFEHRASYAAFGALSENLRLAAASLGVGVEIVRFPDPSDPLLVCQAKLGGAPEKLSPEDQGLFSQIELRVTNRRLSKRTPMREEDVGALCTLAKRSGADLRLATSSAHLDSLAHVMGMSERLRLMSRQMHGEMMRELRWSKEEVLRMRDGLDLATLELTPTDEAGMRLIADWPVMQMVCEVEGGHGLAQPTRKSIASACAVGLLSVQREPGAHVREAYFSGGIALQRVWLRANALGYALQPMTSLIYLFARLEEGAGEGLDERERAELVDLRGRFRGIFGLVPTVRTAEVLLFRLAIAEPPSARSLRRRVEDLLEIA